MKINLLDNPPKDIFRLRRRYLVIFIVLLSLAGSGILLGIYAITAQTAYYQELETAAFALFVGPALFVAYIGEKLQAYKQLTEPQRRELSDLAEKHPEISRYCKRTEKDNRQPVRAEYEACQAWAEKSNRQMS